MDKAQKALVRGWLIKAEHDLASAKKLALDPDPKLDTAIYHCQQTGEKVLKGFLTYYNQPFDKTHDIRLLINQAEKIEPKLHAFLEKASLLTPYATEYRYPGEYLEPEKEEFNEALKAAHDLYTFIISLLPKIDS